MEDHSLCAVAALILTAADHMLRDGTLYQDLGPNHFRRTTPEIQASRLARQIAKFGFTCTIVPATEMEASVQAAKRYLQPRVGVLLPVRQTL